MLVYLGLNLPSSQRFTVDGETLTIMDNTIGSMPRSLMAAANRSEKSSSKKKMKKAHTSFQPGGSCLDTTVMIDKKILIGGVADGRAARA